MSEEISITGTEHRESLECSSLNINGAVTVEQDIRATRITVTGSAVVGGDVEAETISVSGSLRISGKLQAEDATISGFVQTGEETRLHQLILSGEVDFTALHSSKVVGDGIVMKEISADVFHREYNSDPTDV